MVEASQIEEQPHGQRQASLLSTQTPEICRAVVDMWDAEAPRKEGAVESDEEEWSCPSDSEAALPMTDKERRNSTQVLQRMATADLWRTLEATLKREPEALDDHDEEYKGFSFAGSFTGLRSVLGRLQDNISAFAGATEEGEEEGEEENSVPALSVEKRRLQRGDVLLRKAISRAPSGLGSLNSRTSLATASAPKRPLSPRTLLQNAHAARTEEERLQVAELEVPTSSSTGTGASLPRGNLGTGGSELPSHIGRRSIEARKSFGSRSQGASSNHMTYGVRHQGSCSSYNFDRGQGNDMTDSLSGDTGCGSSGLAVGHHTTKSTFAIKEETGDEDEDDTFDGGAGGDDGMLVMHMSSSVPQSSADARNFTSECEYDQDFVGATVSRRKTRRESHFAGGQGSIAPIFEAQKMQTRLEAQNKMDTFHSIVDDLPDSHRRRALEQFVRQEKQISHLESVIRFYEEMLQGGAGEDEESDGVQAEAKQ